MINLRSLGKTAVNISKPSRYPDKKDVTQPRVSDLIAGIEPLVSMIKPPIGILILLSILNSFSAPSYEVWHARNLGLTLSHINGVAYGNGRFIAVGTEGTILVSANGIDWESRPLGTNLALNTISFLQGQFFIGGSRGTILFSGDGEQWTNAVVSVTNDVSAIGFGSRVNDTNGSYIAAAVVNNFGFMRSLILSSSNGLSWQVNYRLNNVSNLLINNRLTSVAAGNQRFVMSGTVDNGSEAVHSARANEWWPTSVGPVAFSGNMFVMAEGFFPSAEGLACSSATSAFGDAWDGPPRPGITSVARAICFGGGRFVLVGDRGAVAVSPDGTNWMARQLDLDVNLLAVAYGAGIYVAVGQTGVILMSNDGLNWTDRSGRTSRHLNSIAPDGDGFVAVGYGGTIITSPDGAEWEQTKAPITNMLTGVLKVGEQYIITGAGGVILTGTNLQNLALQMSGTNATLNGVAHGEDTYAVVGAGGTILTSSDATNWTPRVSNTTNNLLDVIHAGGIFVAVGSRGAIVSSLDGIVWEKREPGTTRTLFRLTHGEGRFVVACFAFGGNDAFVVTSLDGITWTVPVRRVFASYAAAYGNGVFLLTSSLGPLVHASRDTLSWTDSYLTTKGPTTPSSGDMAFNNGSFVCVSSLGSIWQSEPIVRVKVTRDDALQLTVEGPKNATYRIEASDALGTPDSWQEVTTIASPPYTWTDPDAGQQPQRAYRAVLVR